MIRECILLVDSASHLERPVHTGLARFQSDLGHRVANFLPLRVLNGCFPDCLAAGPCWEGVIRVVHVLCLGVQGYLIFFVILLPVIELFEAIEEGLIALSFGEV